MAQLRGILEDLREEVPRIKAGAFPATFACPALSVLCAADAHTEPRVTAAAGRPSLKCWSGAGSSAAQGRASSADDAEAEEGGGQARSGQPIAGSEAPAVASLGSCSCAGLAAPAAAPERSKYLDWPGNSWWGALSGELLSATAAWKGERAACEFL